MVFDEKKWEKLVKYGNVCIGLSSLCPDGSHIVMLDYDQIAYKKVVKDIRQLQNNFRLGDVALIKTKNGYHAYAVTPKFKYNELCEVIQASECDPWFKDKDCRENMRQVILRISRRGSAPIPRFKCIIPSNHNGQSEASLGHWLFLKWFYGAPLRYPAKNDGSNKILVYLYKTLRN
ncbi:MAG: hypothetical protein QXJ07_03385 [Candidatus Bathyarchaeia archaeon]